MAKRFGQPVGPGAYCPGAQANHQITFTGIFENDRAKVFFLLNGMNVAVAVTFTIMSTSLGATLGPLVAGFLQEATGDLKLSLLVLSFTCLSLCVAGLTLPFRANREGAASPDAATAS